MTSLRKVSFIPCGAVAATLALVLLLPLAGARETISSADTGITPSEGTESCIDCHQQISPGIVADWQHSRHARTTVSEAMEKPVLERRISVGDISGIPEELRSISVGCAECHSLGPDTHTDTFEHFGTAIHTVVTPRDCETCHPTEVSQYSQNIMSHAYSNLADNNLYMALVNSVNGPQHYDGSALTADPPDDVTHAESCFHCHGTRVEVAGLEQRETDLGEMEFPKLTGWPNQGVGRVNPDGSVGCCASCHTRHRFSIEMARKPATCSECHKGPDVPAYKVYSVSKHGNTYASLAKDWDFEAVPWVPGRDFSAPTCATCHVSLITSEDDETIAERTHGMNDRLPWRIFGLPYAHPHPISPGTHTIKNSAGLPLPTDLTGEPVAEFLINEAEMDGRRDRMREVCLSCHSSSWTDGQFRQLDRTIEETNEMTLAATQILSQAWETGLAEGPAQEGNPFDEPIEKMWVEQWLFYANSTRFASAMGGADYGVFANGRWYMSKNLREMHEWVTSRGAADQKR